MPIYLKIKRRRESMDNIDTSKFLGDPVMPIGFDYDHNLGEDEIFLAQIDCARAAAFDKSGLLPKSGWLWFFVDIEEYPYTPRVIYSNDEPDEVLEEYNDLWVDDTAKAFGITFSENAEDDIGAAILDSVQGNEVVLLRLDAISAGLPVLNGVKGPFKFVVAYNDIIKSKFDDVRLIIG